MTASAILMLTAIAEAICGVFVIRDRIQNPPRANKWPTGKRGAK